MSSLRRYQELPPRWAQPVPDSPKMDPPLAKPEPINDAGAASLIIYLRKGKKHCAAAVGERSEKI